VSNYLLLIVIIYKITILSIEMIPFTGKWWTLRGELIQRLVERPDRDDPDLRRSELQLSAELDGIPSTGRSPYLSLEDARKLDDVREALRQGDVKSATRVARVYTLTPVAGGVPQ
jgi:hypothetical protein